MHGQNHIKLGNEVYYTLEPADLTVFFQYGEDKTLKKLLISAFGDPFIF